MLKLITSNRFERLTAKLIEALSADVLAPFTPQPVIISSTAIKRSVELRLADERGICANIQFDFLGQWLWHHQRQRISSIRNCIAHYNQFNGWRSNYLYRRHSYNYNKCNNIAFCRVFRC
ncbi:MAG: hypothetical protein EBX30_13545 [Betaproteobacteria bacterium]|nr:hypothetical protein [Betaproteobacteria bacterium]